MKYVYLLAILACAVAVGEGLVCLPNACAGKDCDYVSKRDCIEKGDIYKARGTFCGCCPACIKKLHRGEDCFGVVLSTGLPPTEECECGTSCQSVNNGTAWKCL